MESEFNNLRSRLQSLDVQQGAQGFKEVMENDNKESSNGVRNLQAMEDLNGANECWIHSQSTELSNSLAVTLSVDGIEPTSDNHGSNAPGWGNQMINRTYWSSTLCLRSSILELVMGTKASPKQFCDQHVSHRIPNVSEVKPAPD
ncbi:hypothetical protein L1987_62529 [Smallanthus sonchifolius]|uniref:Uncharacterized protein n=1 Tax=Smallanthus sonchifolius TaxID=185202 RepID=A0ACB9CAL7_9ASTR|nr:hypothetical protein L1987_62529 [Smallanthus sonchifolius]